MRNVKMIDAERTPNPNINTSNEGIERGLSVEEIEENKKQVELQLDDGGDILGSSRIWDDTDNVQCKMYSERNVPTIKPNIVVNETNSDIKDSLAEDLKDAKFYSLTLLPDE